MQFPSTAGWMTVLELVQHKAAAAPGTATGSGNRQKGQVRGTGVHYHKGPGVFWVRILGGKKLDFQRSSEMRHQTHATEQSQGSKCDLKGWEVGTSSLHLSTLFHYSLCLHFFSQPQSQSPHTGGPVQPPSLRPALRDTELSVRSWKHSCPASLSRPENSISHRLPGF